jgi:hypothetical protein
MLKEQKSGMIADEEESKYVSNKYEEAINYSDNDRSSNDDIVNN